jgi:hypothetical protein
VTDKRGVNDMIILIGDFNAKIGADSRDIMETYGLGKMDENGESFVDLCVMNQLVIKGNIFPHITDP